MAPTNVRIVPAYIETGQVIDVDVENYTVSVVTQYTQKSLLGLAFATPYQHFSNGEGIYFMPEVGSLVWLCFPSDGGKPFVLAWAPGREQDDSLKSNKRDLNPGDIFLGTRDDNFLILRRGGVVQVGGGPLSQRMYIPVNNTITDLCENYGLHTLGGDLEWTIDREEATVDGHRPALLRLKAREFADDPEPVAVLEIGSHTANSANILSLAVNASGQPGAARKISLEFRKDGSAAWSFSGNVTWDVTENLSIHSKTLSLLADLDLKVDAKTGKVEITAAALASIFGGAGVALGPNVTVGPKSAAGPAAPVMLATDELLLWLATHRHPIPSPSAPATDVPAPPPPSATSSSLYSH